MNSGPLCWPHLMVSTKQCKASVGCLSISPYVCPIGHVPNTTRQGQHRRGQRTYWRFSQNADILAVFKKSVQQLKNVTSCFFRIRKKNVKSAKKRVALEITQSIRHEVSEQLLNGTQR